MVVIEFKELLKEACFKRKFKDYANILMNNLGCKLLLGYHSFAVSEVGIVWENFYVPKMILTETTSLCHLNFSSGAKEVS